MENFSIFDIVGPVMVGPSSSHTAGATKIAYIAGKIFGDVVNEVTFYLHGSFAKTYKGHGTDKALVAGIMGFLPDDERIVDSFSIADEKKIRYSFIEKDLGEVHPNTVNIDIKNNKGNRKEIVGSSTGGGKVAIINIDGIDVSITGEYETLITEHKDQPGVIADISRIFSNYCINIAFMKLYREFKGENAILVLESDHSIPKEVLNSIKDNQRIRKYTFIEKIKTII